MNRANRILLISVLLVVLLSVSVYAVEPFGASVTAGVGERAAADGAGNDPNAIAGNITNLTISGFSITQSWQGYYGNVTGTIQLADSSDNVLYNWSTASPLGEVYTSNESSSIQWDSIACFNLSNVSEYFEEDFNISDYANDGLNETFNLNNHAGFYTNNVEHTTGECNNTKVFGSGGSATYDEVLLTDGTSLVFASLLQEDASGFDGGLYDFEMLVLEDGHGTDTDTSTYFFWVELE